MKLICMAPKRNTLDVPLNTGPVVGVNTSDRNDTSNDAQPTMMEPNSANGQAIADSNGSMHNDATHSHEAKEMSDEGGSDKSIGNGHTDAVEPQLNVGVGSLKLTAPGTARYNASENTSDSSEIDDKAERLNR